jgi:probable lipoprotein NlpC
VSARGSSAVSRPKPDPTFADRYLAIPFRDFGRSWSGCDCFGLYALILATEADARLHEVGVSAGTSPRAVIAKVAEEVASGRWEKVETPQRFDLVQMLAYAQGRRSADLHIGCVTGRNHIIHTEKPHGVKHQRLDSLEIKPRIVAFWRPKVLTDR